MNNNYILINGKKDDAKPLKHFAPGSIVMIGNREYIVLEHSNDTTAVITKEIVEKMPFGIYGNYLESEIRKYCNSVFYNELIDTIGAGSIVPHTVNLIAADGTGKDIYCRDNVSILTVDLYRRYREFLPDYSDSWWLATRMSYSEAAWSCSVCYITSYGIPLWYGCDSAFGVRPFLILNASTLATCG